MNISEKDKKILDDKKKELEEDPNIDHDWLAYRLAEHNKKSDKKD